jgi:putative endonuclease
MAGLGHRTTSDLGKEGEEIARRYLREGGLTILQSNYRWVRAEVDIVAEEGEVLVFCEVKMRTNDRYGAPEYAITPKKQRQVKKAALGYLTEHKIRDRICRFDVVAIEQFGTATEIRHLRNAF